MNNISTDLKQEILQNKIIVIVRGVPSASMPDLAKALYDGGIRMMEVTFDQKSTDNYRETTDAIRAVVTQLDGKMHIGAGTVMTARQVQLAKEAGAEYIISPNVCREVIEETKRLGLLSMPGALTPSEIADAYAMGADFVKVFPISNFGVGYLKAISAPLSHIPLLAVGGVRPETMAEYGAVGACGFGVGGNLVNKEWIRSKEFDKITAEARRYCKALEG